MSSRQNLHAEIEKGLNNQINVELTASYTYLSMYNWLRKDTVALPGLAAYFLKQSREEREHAQKFIDLLVDRGGVVILQDLKAPEADWKSATNILATQLSMEKSVNQALLDLCALASEHNDPQLEDFIAGDFLQEQVDDIKHAADMVTQLNLAGGDGLGLYLFDKNVSA